jgi:glutamate-ammonia-ligase adenylyltransferase
MSAEDAALLKKAYCSYRDYGHHQVLQGESATASVEEFQDMRIDVDKLWQQLME